MTLWATLILLGLMTYLWLAGRSNPDDVIGLLEQILAITLGLVVLFIGRSLLLELWCWYLPYVCRLRVATILWQLAPRLVKTC